MERFSAKIGRGTVVFLAILLLAGVTGYLRVRWPCQVRSGTGTLAQSVARNMTLSSIRKQMKEKVDSLLPGVPEETRQTLANSRADALMESDRNRFEETVLETAFRIERSLSSGGNNPFLLEADPYYYFSLTETARNSGRIGREYRDGKFFNPMRRYPHGAWVPVSWHPYVGLFFYRAVHCFFPEMSLTQALSYLPVALSVFAVILFFFAVRVLGAGLFSAIAGSFVFTAAPIFIQRSALGWYDTDPYNLIFPLMILILYFRGMDTARRSLPHAFAAGALTGLYSMFWQGWAFIFVILAASGTLILVLSRFSEGRRISMSGSFLVTYGFSTVICAGIFMTPAGLWDSVVQGWKALCGFSKTTQSVWPNIFLTVGEAQSVSLNELVRLEGYYGTALLALAGALASGFYYWRRRDRQGLSRYLTVLAMGGVLLVMSLKTERFSLLFILPFAMLAVFGMEQILFLADYGGRKCGLSRGAFGWLKGASVLMIFLLAVPIPWATALDVSSGIRPIMNEAWSEALGEIKEKTPENAVVHSWWPPGYFIVALGGRRVISDGGSQHLAAVYWIARAFLSEDERTAAGIFRLLDRGGNDALEYLESLGISTETAIDLIMKIVPLNRGEAVAQLPPELTGGQKEKVLSLTHGDGPPPPSYVFLYDDLIDQNLAMQVMAQWNFGKAKRRLEDKKHSRKRRFVTMINKAGRLFAARALCAEVNFVNCGLRKMPLKSALLQAAVFSHSRVVSEAVLPALQEKFSRLRNGLRALISDFSGDDARGVFDVVDRVLKYTPESFPESEQGGILSFRNGLKVDRRTMDSYVNLQGKEVRGRPVSLFSMEGGKLEERVNGGERIDVSALLAGTPGSYSAVLADRDLIRSMLFRLYYLKGEGLLYFKPFSEKYNPVTRTRIIVYSLDWAEFEKEGNENHEGGK